MIQLLDLFVDVFLLFGGDETPLVTGECQLRPPMAGPPNFAHPHYGVCAVVFLIWPWNGKSGDNIGL